MAKSKKIGGLTITAKKVRGGKGWVGCVKSAKGGTLPGVAGDTEAGAISRTAALCYKSGAKANPLRHFPKLKGRGRPQKLKTWEMTTVLSNGAVAVRSGLKATKEQAAAKANAILKRRFKGRKVREVMLDDGR